MSDWQKAIPLTEGWNQQCYVFHVWKRLYWHWCATWQELCFTAFQDLNFRAEKEQLSFQELLNSLISTHLATSSILVAATCLKMTETYYLFDFFLFVWNLIWWRHVHVWSEPNSRITQMWTQSREEDDCMISHMSQTMLTQREKNLSLISVKAMCFTTSKKN